MSENNNKNSETENKHLDVPTTGHSWDGIEEYDNPMPRWWLWTFYVCVAWAIIYSLAMPAWPIYGSEGATKGFLEWTSRNQVEEEIREANIARADIAQELVEVDLLEIHENDNLYEYATNAGDSVFKTWCAQCHGSGAAGVQAQGYPNLLDDDWLWGGTIDEIYTTIAHGVRNDDEDSRYSEMPSFGDMLEDSEIDAVTHYVLSLSGSLYDEEKVTLGEELYLENCAGCHMEDGTGDIYGGAPNLTDAVWLYGAGYQNIKKQITNARNGVMPSWNKRISEADLKAVSTYVHSLGGGKTE